MTLYLNERLTEDLDFKTMIDALRAKAVRVHIHYDTAVTEGEGGSRSRRPGRRRGLCPD